MQQRSDFARVIASCLASSGEPAPTLLALVRDVLAMPEGPTRAELEAMQRRIAATPGATNSVALVYGGATKIKGYVFEASKLPEIRGASALLDWVNERGVRQIWHAALDGPFGDADLVAQCVVYASGGSFLAFAPAALAQNLATAVERRYTAETLTANSAAVQRPFGLLELRFGRDPLRYWADEFLQDCRDEQRRAALLAYYYPPEGVDPADTGEEALRRRFLHRKGFGELVTVLATMFNRRRDERAAHGEPRSLPRFELSPWAAKCQSSDVRPAIVAARVGADTRLLSEPSARKLAAGRVVKRSIQIGDLDQTLHPWKVPADLHHQSWEQRWQDYLLSDEGRTSPYALAQGGRFPKPASDVGQISAASRPSRYIGLIYADGNNIGRLMATLTSPRLYQEASAALSEVAQHAVLSALAAHLEPVEVPDDEEGGRKLVHPFEILAIGGDDLFVVVPGDRACDIALHIARVFETELTKRFAALGLAPDSATALGGRYAGRDPAAAAFKDAVPAAGLSAGVLIAQENAPFFFLRGLVEQLLKGAKRLARDNAAAFDREGRPKPRFYGGAVDFMVLKSTTMVTDKIGTFRAAALADHEKSKRRLTARPYTWAEFAGLLATTRALKAADVPRSQLYRLRRALDQDDGEGILTSVMEYLYTRARQRERVAGALKAHVEEAWCLKSIGTQERLAMPPWSPRGDTGYETIWPDLVETWEFVAETQRGGELAPHAPDGAEAP